MLLFFPHAQLLLTLVSWFIVIYICCVALLSAQTGQQELIWYCQIPQNDNIAVIFLRLAPCCKLVGVCSCQILPLNVCSGTCWQESLVSWNACWSFFRSGKSSHTLVQKSHENLNVTPWKRSSSIFPNPHIWGSISVFREISISISWWFLSWWWDVTDRHTLHSFWRLRVTRKILFVCVC